MTTSGLGRAESIVRTGPPVKIVATTALSLADPESPLKRFVALDALALDALAR
jgi:hypothetical protein